MTDTLANYEGSPKQLQDEIERIIISRSYSKRIDGYTLEMAIQIMDTIAAWNRRAVPSPDVAVREALDKLTAISDHCEMFDDDHDMPMSLGDLRRARAVLASRPAMAVPDNGTFQERVRAWLLECFGEKISGDRLERGDRLLEEVMELLQSGDYPRERVAALTDYVWNRDKGEPHQETGGVAVTLAAYCWAHDLDLHKAAEDELARVWTKIDKIRAKQAAKPPGSALPIASPSPGIGEGQ